jgi:2,3,4,5-tetrahydropyridine-2-carboxylate N-succinyltransferase
MNLEELKPTIESAFKDRSLLSEKNTLAAISQTIDLLDNGKIRVAEKINNQWVVNSWIKEAILLHFATSKMEVTEVGPFEFHDKIKLKTDYSKFGIRVVPPAVMRYGSFAEPGAIMMPSYVNIGAYVGKDTMVDTWATVGSCAQIGAGVHLSGGVGIGGVLEPPSAQPVIVEDGAFIGSRCILVEGVIVESEAVLGANVTITASTQIIDVTGDEPVIHIGRVPARSVVIPGSTTKKFAAGEFGVSCALIIGQRKESTDKKTSLNDVLRNFQVSV